MNSKLQYIVLFLIVGAGCFLNACPQPVNTVDKWQARILEAHGGADTLAQVSTILFSGKIATREDKGTVVLVLSRPGKLRTTMQYLKGYEDRVLLENRGWRNSGTGFEEAAEYSLEAMIFQYNHLNLPMGVIDGNYKIGFVEQKIGDRLFPALKLTGAGGPPMIVIIDPDTGLIRQVDGRIRVGSREVIMGVGYRDYKQVSGVMLPHRIINYVNGIAIAESRYDTVTVNTELNGDFFTIGGQQKIRK